MWTSTLLLACLASLAAAHTLPGENERYFEASKDYLHKQKQILKLFLRQQEPEYFQDFAEIIKTYKLEEHVDKYEDSSCVKNFINRQKAGLLFPRDVIYNHFSEHGVEELKIVFELFLHAKDFDTLVKTAVYMRERINLGILFYAFTTALEVREDTRDFYFPPRYEVYPYLFVDETVIQRALEAKIKALESGNHEKIVIHSNCTGRRGAHLDPETTLSYFTEDVGLNTLNVEFDRRFPAWWDSHKYQGFHDRRGELFLHYQRQLLARYYLERLSNNLGDIPYTMEMPLPGYYPRLRYHNGQEVTPRQPCTIVRDTEESLVKDLRYMNYNLWRAIDVGRIEDVNGTRIPLDHPRGLDVMGELVYFYGDSPNENLYGAYLHDKIHHMGHLADPQGDFNLAPSALMRPETTLRDPLYYIILNKFFDEVHYRYIEKLPMHTYEDLLVPGLMIEDVHVDDLITYFEDFDVELFNVHNLALTKEQDIDIHARLRRLNHRHFNYKVSVDSDKDMDAVVKVYIVPKYDSQDRLIPLNKRVFYSFEIDMFHAKVPAGKSTIERKCDDSTVAVKDPPTFSEIWDKVEAALEDKEPFKVDKFARPYGFPQRLLLPKGRKYGLPVEIAVAIFPYQEADTTDLRAYHLDSFPLLGASYGVKYPDPRPIDFPIDRPFRSEHDADVPNIFTKDVRIYHKSLAEINTVPDVQH